MERPNFAELGVNAYAKAVNLIPNQEFRTRGLHYALRFATYTLPATAAITSETVLDHVNNSTPVAFAQLACESGVVPVAKYFKDNGGQPQGQIPTFQGVSDTVTGPGINTTLNVSSNLESKNTVTNNLGVGEPVRISGNIDPLNPREPQIRVVVKNELSGAEAVALIPCGKIEQVINYTPGYPPFYKEALKDVNDALQKGFDTAEPLSRSIWNDARNVGTAHPAIAKAVVLGLVIWGGIWLFGRIRRRFHH